MAHREILLQQDWVDLQYSDPELCISHEIHNDGIGPQCVAPPCDFLSQKLHDNLTCVAVTTYETSGFWVANLIVYNAAIPAPAPNATNNGTSWNSKQIFPRLF